MKRWLWGTGEVWYRIEEESAPPWINLGKWHRKYHMESLREIAEGRHAHFTEKITANDPRLAMAIGDIRWMIRFDPKPYKMRSK